MAGSSFRWQVLLNEIYGEAQARGLGATLQTRLAGFQLSWPGRTLAEQPLTARDVMLITYGDQLRLEGQPTLQTLADFCERHLAGLVTCLHILPFYPYSSDDGFSVIDFRQVDPALGGWAEIARLNRHFRLMFDGVINHISAQSAWFRAFLRDEDPYRDYFIVMDGDPDLSAVVRPRALPLLTRFGDPPHEKRVWTTFSADQVDLNYRNPQVLLEIIDLLLFYVSHGAEFIRLDAIAYLWKEPGTTCIHLPQTHRIIQLFRAILDEVAPHVKLITETNVPHLDNISYFGSGSNEAQLVYNFALPPLVLHTLQSGDARALSRWAASLGLPSRQVTFFNFLASHDGIGLNPVRGILSDAEIDALVRCAEAHGGLVSYKHNPDGSQSPYELNINYFDALSNPAGDEPPELQVQRFMAAQAIMLALPGLPGLYFHSLFGSRGWRQGVQETGHPRSINRQKFLLPGFERDLRDSTSLRHAVFHHTRQLLRTRGSSAAFDPYGTHECLDLGGAIWALLRNAPQPAESVLCLQNVTAQPQTISLHEAALPGQVDLLSGDRFAPRQGVHFSPYQTRWLVQR